jgi:pentatricopeptide repeat protein
MREAGVRPNAHTFTCLITGAARGGDLAQVRQLFKQMKEQVRGGRHTG